MTPSSRRGANKSSLAAAALCWLAVAISQVSLQVAQTVQVHDQQQQQQQQLASWAAKPKLSRLELKFQSELDESKIVKHSGQQQVFKCQVRLAPAGGADGQWLHSQPGRARLKSSSRWLTTTTAEETRPYASPDSSTWDGAALAPALAPLKFNVSELTIEWLKNGRPLGVSYAASGGGGGDKISVVNVTLKTRHQQQTLDKMPRGRAPKPRLEIKNTLNGQQLKLTSRLRIGQMRDGDAGQFQCVARARFVLAEPDADHSAASTKRELVEQSLESASAHLIVWPTGASANHDSIGDTGRPRSVQPDDVPFRAIKQQDQQQGQSLDSDDEGPPVRFEPQPGQRVEPPTSATSLFEDDEDLFRLNSGELISGDAAAGGGGGAQSTNDNEQEQQIIGSDTTNNDLNGLLVVGVGREKSQQHAEAHLDWILGDHDGDGPAPDNGDQSGLSSSSQQPPLSRRRSQPGGYHKIDDRAREVGESLVSGGEDYSTRLVPRTHSGANEPTAASTFNHRRPAAADGRAKESSSSAAAGQWLTGAHEYAESSRTRSKLAKLVHTIVAAESSCYTGAGELYRGNAAHSADQRVCLNWLQVRASLAGRARDASSRLKSQQQQQQHAQRDNQTITQADYLSGASLSSSAYIDGADHNHCRNPNGDPRGPWCFVAYSEPLDGVILTAQSMPPPHAQSGGQRKVITHRHRVVRVGLSGEGASAPPLLVVVGPCAQVISCSEYLWLYVVAPPLGLLIMLTCLASFAVRSIRRSRCNAVYQRQVAKSASSSGGGSASALSLGLGKLLAQNRRPPRKRLMSTAITSTTKEQPSLVCCGLGKTTKSARRGQNHATRKTPSYLDDDIFEIVDDIDWSDGPTTAAAGPVSQATTMSPKSVGELFNLHASASEGSHQSATSPRRMAANKCGADELLLADWHAQITHSKSTNPVFSEQALDLQLSQRQQHQQAAAANLAMDSRRAAGQNKMSKSRSQAGPMFATLRCHVRNTHQKRLAADSGGSGSARRRDGELSQSQAKKSSSFIEPRHEYSNGEMHRGSNCAEWMVQPAVGTISSSTHSDSSSARTGHLISCAASSCDSNGGGGDGSNALTSNNDMLLVGADSEGLTLASELPRLDAANVTLAYEAEPIYEGKFSQVLRAYLRQNELDLTQATGRIGAQVAVCSLKQQAAMDESVFHASGLRLHNLNHLNILKLLGYVPSSQLADAMGDELTNPKASKDSVQASGFRCSLVYDMAHLIDLSDWLKEQCKDAIVARDDEISGDLSLRQNLTCVAKQVALALDYLHDKNIVYKDLACRNCFLDVTRMLVKLASFNVEPEFVSQEESPAYGHSGVPGPSSSKIQNSEDNSQQELLSKKLSLKSMVRPKYLLDYYVIDSRPSECQLLPLSWIPLESILFNKFNKQTDIWSFGCLLYELFSLGEVAYFGYSSKQVIDAVRSNMMPPQPLLCPNGIYKLMCKCLSDIPTLRPNIKHVYEQLNLYSGQCSSFLNHHLCMI